MIKYMRRFAQECPARQIGQQPAEQFALRGVSQPIGVAEWETQLTQSLPAELAASLPSVAELEAELQADWPEDRA